MGCGERPLEPRDPTPGVANFTIATFNVEDGKQTDAATVEAIGATHADIICLQEIGDGWEQVIKARYAADYPYMLFKPGGTGGLGVLAKDQIVSHTFTDGTAGGHPSWSLYAKTEAGWFSLLTVHLRSLYSGNKGIINDYLDWGVDHRTQVSSVVASKSAALMPVRPPELVMGDFNEGPDGDAVQYLESVGFQDVLPLFHPGQFTWRHPSLANQFNEALDHILFDDWVTPLNANVVNRGNSDHIPVVARFEVARTWPAFEPPLPGG
jgi:endonuclease/exonuclease/phosphatase (EEP) superfamily protein YafD